MESLNWGDVEASASQMRTLEDLSRLAKVLRHYLLQDDSIAASATLDGFFESMQAYLTDKHGESTSSKELTVQNVVDALLGGVIYEQFKGRSALSSGCYSCKFLIEEVALRHVHGPWRSDSTRDLKN